MGVSSWLSVRSDEAVRAALLKGLLTSRLAGLPVVGGWATLLTAEPGSQTVWTVAH
jgi:hypothetical protein